MPEPRRPARPNLSGSESIAISLIVIAAAIVVGSYLVDRVGVAFAPWPTAATALVFGAITLVSLGRSATWEKSETLAFSAIVILTFVWLLWIARPAFFPLGSGPDLTHHLLLIRYIEQHWRLVHEAAAQEFLGEMVQYTPGSHILTALSGAWSRSNGLHAMHAVMSASAALKSGFVFLIAMRMLPRDLRRVPVAVLASMSLFASQIYFLGSFAQYSFLAQVVSECFTIAMWWTIVIWDQEPSRWPMYVAGLLGAAIFLTWPILIGPPLVLLGVLALLPNVTPRRDRFVDAAIAVVPIALVAALFSVGRMNYLVIAGTGGEAVWPAVRAYGWWFLVLSAVGLLMAGGDMAGDRERPKARSAFVFASAILLQAAVLYVFARARGNDPYMMRKMFYMLLYAQAVGVAICIGMIARRSLAGTRRAEAYVLWAAVALIAILLARPLAGAPRSLVVAKHPATSLELEQAGYWILEHADPRCVEYLVGDDNTAYWLHLAVLGNPRRGPRTGDNATYELTPALVRWLTPGGWPYAIADLRVIPTDITSGAVIAARFGSVAIIKRQGPASCNPQ